jgi:hypothetical protein
MLVFFALRLIIRRGDFHSCCRLEMSIHRVSLRQWQHGLTFFGGDNHFVSKRLGTINTANTLVDAGARNHDHHYSRRPIAPARTRHVFAERMPDDQLLQRRAVFKNESLGAKAADSGAELLRVSTRALRRRAFRRARPVVQPESRHGQLCCLNDRHLLRDCVRTLMANADVNSATVRRETRITLSVELKI